METKQIEKINEELSEYTDRQIVVEVLGILTEKQLIKLVETLKRNY